MTSPRPHGEVDGSVTHLLLSWRDGDPAAFTRLMSLVYTELHGLARAQLLVEAAAHTLQPTALVNEAYLRLVGQSDLPASNRLQFFSIAARLMRQVLVDHARSRRALKRGGGALKVTLTNRARARAEDPVSMLMLDRALTELAALSPQQARVVELRYFAGLTIRETSAVMRVSLATVKREWSTARAFLLAEMEAG